MKLVVSDFAIARCHGLHALAITRAYRTSCRSPLDNQIRLILHTAAYWRGPERALNNGGDLIILDCSRSAWTGLIQ
ncbi:hypothetical protein IYY11_04180 [Methylocystis sp. H62]|uniref:hypothetical protein n=1 Tax=Methylocystis sp. H62 TaxID=2785789 RepID=UPI0018C22C29|nr:hypothetical protein [Methylocystis sp. H62]MBG0792629.1 hypothetical protein [Methylocystis sp. H62]